MNDCPKVFPDSLIEILRSARQLVVLTGAGTSAESGVPTFREAQTGLWARFKPEELATPEAFRRNPRMVWEWYQWRRKLVAAAEPNAGHRALVEMERHVPRFTLITQNVDGLHQRAGSRTVIELHGNITRTRCFEDDQPVAEWVETGEVPPRCPRCGGPLRPDVVWFGEMLPPGVFEAAERAVEGCDLCFTIGTSAVVQPAASLPLMARCRGATVVEINPALTPITDRADFAFQAPSGTVLPALCEAVWGLPSSNPERSLRP